MSTLLTNSGQLLSLLMPLHLHHFAAGKTRPISYFSPKLFGNSHHRVSGTSYLNLLTVGLSLHLTLHV